MVELDPTDFNFLVKMRTVPIGASSTGVFTVEGCKLGKPTALDLHLKCPIAGRNLKLTATGRENKRKKFRGTVAFL
jgi:hypothetical protein